MANEPVDADLDEHGGVLKPEIGSRGCVAGRPADLAKQADRIDNESERGGQQERRDHLPDGEHVAKPVTCVQQNKSHHQFERKEPVEAVGTRGSQGSPCEQRDSGGRRNEDSPTQQGNCIMQQNCASAGTRLYPARALPRDWSGTARTPFRDSATRESFLAYLVYLLLPDHDHQRTSPGRQRDAARCESGSAVAVCECPHGLDIRVCQGL
jgi:hypothetical protein